MKGLIKKWAVNNLLELKSWCGLLIIFCLILDWELIGTIIAMILMVVPETSFRAALEAAYPKLKEWIEKL